MFEENVQLLVTAPVWIIDCVDRLLAFRITDYSLWKYHQHKNFQENII